MQIVRRIPVKQVLTPDSRTKLQQKFQERNTRYENECRQLAFEQKKLERKPGVSREEVRKRFSRELSKRKDQMRWLDYQLKQLNELPDGSELETDEVEVIVEVVEGDLWQDVMDDQAIVVKDGIVIRAR
ncbi:YlqD family protein [Thalassobacillus sp. CUG 92003]|uniref:YlqD family protein n=1 Tax=Thalassobacillus sp. CUG 92003 TaxID=2736641 RepID=UPI0015E65911|nr:YlqD family protein [Thalassobacillus sp. CUG 92003]